MRLLTVVVVAVIRREDVLQARSSVVLFNGKKEPLFFREMIYVMCRRVCVEKHLQILAYNTE